MLFSVLCMHFSSQDPAPLRVLVVASGVVAAVLGAAWSLVTALRDMAGLVRSPGRASLEEVVIAASAAAALLLLLWVSVGLLAAVLATLPGPLGLTSRVMRDAIAPQAVRRWAGVLLGVAVMSSCGPGGAVASEIGSVRTLDGEVSSSAPAPLWAEPTPAAGDTTLAPTAPAPEWTPPAVRPLPPVTLTAPRPSTRGETEVTVRRGDTLWDLAAAYLPPEATDAEIATACRRWHTANRNVIGPDPDLILPGQVLTVPTAVDAAPAGGIR
jgi:hypothetical protein